MKRTPHVKGSYGAIKAGKVANSSVHHYKISLRTKYATSEKICG